MKKRILSMIIAIVMVAGMIPGGALTAFAAETDCDYLNPHSIQLPYTSETLNLTYGDGWDHYYTWTAPEAGTLTVVMPEGLHCDIRIDGRDADSGANTTLTVDVAAGEVVILNVYPVNDVNGTWSASFAAGETTAPEGGETTGTLEIYLKLKAVNAEGEDISNLGNGLDVVLNGGEWVGTYSGTGNDDGKFNVIIGENTLSNWDYCPTGYLKPADVTFTVAADGTVTCNDSHVTVEKDGDFTVLVITLEADSAEGGEDPEPTPETITVYFQNNWLWTNVSLYYSMEDSNSIDNWPGEAMVYYGNDGTYDVYSYELPVDVAYFVINGIKDDGSGDRDKTPNITEGFYDGICYYMMWNDGNAVGSEHIDVIFPPTTVDIYLKLKAVNAEGEDISDLGNGLDVVLNGGEWVGTYSGTGNDDGKFNVIIGENTLSNWDYCPTGYLKPADVTFTVAADGTVTCNDSHVTVEKDGDFTVLVITLEADSAEGGETGHTHTYDNGYYYSNGEYHYAYCDTCEYYDPDSAEAHYEDAAYSDHHCDVCGVYVRAWCTPIDPETDHCCINGENCGARLDDLCTDADNDHICDGCGDDMRWLCEDTGADHLCDVCDAYMLELCEDADGDHICDAEACGERISPCDDVDNDNKCDICDAELRAAWNDTDDDGVIDEGETVYSFLYHAFSDPAATIIKLLEDVSDFSVVFEGNAVTLDLNGHTVTLNGWFDITTAASLTIKDSSTAKTGRIICDVENSYYMDVYSDGTLTLQGGTVDQMRLDYDTAAITLTGGTVGKMIVRHGEVILGDANVAEWKISGGTFNVDPTTLNGFDSDNYAAVNNNDGTWTVQEKNPDDFVDEHFHDKEGYEVIWSENFDGETFPESFTAVDKDGDDHGWHISAHEGHVHGCTDGSAVVSYSYINETSTPLNSNNLLLTPTLELEEGKEYLLSFMVKAVDENYPDSYDIHISLDGGETYDWSCGIQESAEAWEEVVLDLSAYAGKNVTVVIEHKDYDMFCLAVDCFYLYEKSATGGEGGSEGEEFTGVSLYASSLTLDGTIGLNLYFRLGDDVLASQDAFVRFSLEDGRIIEIPVAEGVAAEVEGVTYYKFTCKMYAKQMSDTVKIQVFDGETALTQELEHSVVDYATVLLQMADTNPAYADVAPLIEAMLHYGARAQLYFGYNTEKLADAGIDAADLSGVTAATFESYRATGMTIDGIGKFVSSNLVLESETTLKLYFLADEGVDASALEFTVGNEAITPTTYGEYLVIAITDIKSDELDNEFTVTVTNGTEAQGSFTTSVYAYCYNTVVDAQGLYNDEIKDTLKALYLYNVAADAYFN